MRICTFLFSLASAGVLIAPVASFAAEDDVFAPSAIVIEDSSDSIFEETTPDVFAPATDVFSPSPAFEQSTSAPTGDISALDSMRSAINYSPALKSIRESRATAQYELSTSRGSYLPSLDVVGSVGYGAVSTVTTRANGTDGDFEPNLSGTATLTQPLFAGFGIKNTVDYNQDRVLSLDQRVLDNASTVALEALIAHSEVLRLRELIDITADYVETHLVIIGQLEMLVASGINTTSDVSQAQGRLVGAQVSQQNVRNAYEAALINYKQVTGHDFTENLLPIELPMQEIDGMDVVLANANSNNPKILALQSDLSAASQQVGIARAGYFPSFTLNLQATYEDDRLGSEVDQYEYTLNAGIGLRWNLFNGFATENSRRSANANVRVSQQNLLDTVDTVTAEVKTAYEDYMVSETLRLSYSQALLYNSSTRDSYMSQFRFGTRPLLDLLDAETELYGTQVQLGIMSSNRIIGAWQLLALQGRLLEELGVQPEAFMTNKSTAPVEDVQFSF